ncbi:hypothetical protein [Vandammella animalimorsus]|uniref:DUF4124 domain-containing protein n=1 Tax=Vandammella animalimorsus TaxID=2029117 RepID=A0A2A2AG88_9BURK|nr:hypothetical protein [Vandammella animalimorsus]PAT37580.1 hypothetical protein CK625_04640 [Vandammella animalimorsus]
MFVTRRPTRLLSAGLLASAAALAALAAPGSAAAQQTYKCKGPGGKTIYQQTPCAGATSGGHLIDDVTRQRQINRQQRKDDVAQERVDRLQLQRAELDKLRPPAASAAANGSSAAAATTSSATTSNATAGSTAAGSTATTSAAGSTAAATANSSGRSATPPVAPQTAPAAQQ